MSEQSSYSWQPFGGNVKVTVFSSALEDIEGDIINAGERARGVLLASRIRDQVAVINALAMGSGAATGGTLQTSIEHMQEVLSVWRDSTTLPNPVGAYRWIRSGEDGESVCRRELPGIKKFLKGPPYVFIVFQKTESAVEGIAFFDQDEETLQRLPIEVKLSGETTGATTEPPRVPERRSSLNRFAEKRQDEGNRPFTSDWPETQYVPTPSAPAVHPLMQSGIDVNDSAVHRDYPVPGDFIAPPPAPTRAVDTVSSSPPPLPFEATRSTSVERPAAPSRSSDLERAAPEHPADRPEPPQRTELPYEAFATLSAAATPAPETKSSNIWIAVAAVVAVMLAGLAWFMLRSPSSPAAATPTSGTLDLHITRRNGDLEISWDRNAAAISRANKGLLTINDGGKKTDLYLEDSHLRTGRVLYSPVTGDIDVRLEVEQNAASPISESVRVISAGGEKPPVASVPASTPEPVQTRRREADSGVQTARVNPQPQQQPPDTRRVADPGERRIYVPPPQARPSMPQGTARLEAAAPQVASNSLESVSGPPVSSLPTAPSAPALEPTPAQSRIVQGPPVPATIVPERRRPARQAETPSALVDRASPVPVSQSPVVVPTALRSMITGPVEVRVGVVVSSDGRVVAASTVPPNSPLMNQLSKIASDAAMRWKFDPAVRNGKPVAGRYELVFRFRK